MKVAICVALACLLGSSAAAGTPSIHLVREGFAMWSVGEASHGTRVVLVSASADVRPDGSTSRVRYGFFRGFCDDTRDLDTCWISISGKQGSAPPEAFQVSATLETAELTVKTGGEIHRVRWSATGGGEANAYEPYCEDSGASVAGRVRRDAVAEGRVLKKKMREPSLIAASLAVVAAVDACNI